MRLIINIFLKFNKFKNTLKKTIKYKIWDDIQFKKKYKFASILNIETNRILLFKNLFKDRF